MFKTLLLDDTNVSSGRLSIYLQAVFIVVVVIAAHISVPAFSARRVNTRGKERKARKGKEEEKREKRGHGMILLTNQPINLFQDD